jgi:hemophore-related protein
MTGLKGQPVADIRAQVQQYLNDNPQTKAEIQAIRAPLADIRTRCGAGEDVALQ